MYEIRFHPDVIRRDLKKLDRPLQQKILNQILKKLTLAPTEYGSPLRYALNGYWRLRVEDYRVIYEIDAQRSLVTVWLVDQRKDDHVYVEFLKRMSGKGGFR